MLTEVTILTSDGQRTASTSNIFLVSDDTALAPLRKAGPLLKKKKGERDNAKTRSIQARVDVRYPEPGLCLKKAPPIDSGLPKFLAGEKTKEKGRPIESETAQNQNGKEHTESVSQDHRTHRYRSLGSLRLSLLSLEEHEL